jgi:hypothetical protein
VETIDYLRVARQRLVILLVVPLISGLAVAGYVYLKPALYTSSALVGAPALVGGSTTNQYNGAQGVLQFVSAFQAAGESAVVLQKVAAATKVTPASIDAGLTIAQTGSSSIMRVTFEGRDKTRVDKVAQLTATETLHYLFGSQVTLAQHRVDDATNALAKIDADMAVVAKASGAVQPDQLYQSKQQQVINLQQQQLQLQAGGNTAGAASVASQIASVKRELAQLAPFVTKYVPLSKQRDSAAALLATAQGVLLQAKSQAEAADPARVLTMTATHPSDKAPLYWQKVLPAVGAGFFLAALLVAAAELLRRRRVDVLDPIPAHRHVANDDLLLQSRR